MSTTSTSTGNSKASRRNWSGALHAPVIHSGQRREKRRRRADLASAARRRRDRKVDEDIWQLHYSLNAGKDANPPDDFIANLEPSDWLQVDSHFRRKERDVYRHQHAQRIQQALRQVALAQARGSHGLRARKGQGRYAIGMRNKKWVRLLAYVTGSVNQELLVQNEYLAAENRILRAKLPSRLRLSDPERVTLAEVGKRLGRKALRAVACVAQPDTILAWYRVSPKPSRADDSTRWMMAALNRRFNWCGALVAVQADTLIRWHRKGFRLFDVIPR